jgi:hypothetical protein
VAKVIRTQSPRLASNQGDWALHKAAWEPIGASMAIYKSNAVRGKATLSGGRCGWGDWQVYAFPAAALGIPEIIIRRLVSKFKC